MSLHEITVLSDVKPNTTPRKRYKLDSTYSTRLYRTMDSASSVLLLERSLDLAKVCVSEFRFRLFQASMHILGVVLS